MTGNVINRDQVGRYAWCMENDVFEYAGSDKKSNYRRWIHLNETKSYKDSDVTSTGQISGEDIFVTEGVPILEANPSCFYGVGSEYIVKGGSRYMWNGSEWI